MNLTILILKIPVFLWKKEDEKLKKKNGSHDRVGRVFVNYMDAFYDTFWGFWSPKWYCSFEVYGICTEEQWLTLRDTLVIWGTAIPGGDEKAQSID